MKRTSSRLLLGLLGIATSAGLVLGGKAVGDNVAKGAVEANAAYGDTYVKVTQAPTSWTGTYLLVAEDAGINGEDVIFNASLSNYDVAGNVVTTQVKDNTIRFDDIDFGTNDVAEVTVEIEDLGDGKIALKAGNDYFFNDDTGNDLKWDSDVHELSFNFTAEGIAEISETSTILTYSLNKEHPDTSNRFRFMKSSSYESNISLYKKGEAEEVPTDLKPTQIVLGIGTASETVYQNGELVKDGFEINVTFGSETNPEYVSTRSINADDEHLTWNIDTSKIGDADLTVTYTNEYGTATSNVVTIEVIGLPAGDKHMFDDTSDYANWSGSYASHTLFFPGIMVEFASANKQSSGASINTMPVTKGGAVTVTSLVGPMSSLEIGLKQWGTKKQTATLSIGNSVDSLAEADSLSVNGDCSISATGSFVVAKLTFSSSSNQVGIAYADVKFAYEQEPVDPNIAKVLEFVDTYLLLEDYTTNEGKCLGADGYYVKARTALIALGEECITLFQEDEQFDAAQARYENWARFNGDDSPYAGTFTASAAARINNDDNSKFWIVAGISVAVIGAGAALFFLRKKKEA